MMEATVGMFLLLGEINPWLPVVLLSQPIKLKPRQVEQMLSCPNRWHKHSHSSLFRQTFAFLKVCSQQVWWS